MGLSVYAKDMDRTMEYDCGYSAFGRFVMALAKCYDPKAGELFERWHTEEGITDAEYEEMINSYPKALWILLDHSDCDGKITWKESREIYKIIEPLHMDERGHNYGTLDTYNMLEKWKSMLLFSWKHRRTLWFS